MTDNNNNTAVFIMNIRYLASNNSSICDVILIIYNIYTQFS